MREIITTFSREANLLGRRLKPRPADNVKMAIFAILTDIVVEY